MRGCEHVVPCNICSSWCDYHLLNHLGLCGPCQTMCHCTCHQTFSSSLQLFSQFQLVHFLLPQYSQFCQYYSLCFIFQPLFYVVSAALWWINIMYKNSSGASDLWEEFPSNIYRVCSSYIMVVPSMCYQMQQFQRLVV